MAVDRSVQFTWTMKSVPNEWPAALAAFAKWMIAAGRPRTTIDLRLSHLRRFAEQVPRDPFDVAPDDLLDYIGDEHQRWKPNYRRSLRSTLRAFYRWAEHYEHVGRNPALVLPSVAVPRAKARPLPVHVLEAALDRADAREHLWVVLGYRVGLRCVEIARVRRDDLIRDLVGWSLRVTGKGGHEGIVPINDEVADELHRWIAAHGIDDYLFEGAVDGHVSGSWVSKRLSRVIDEGTGHQLRHRYVTNVLRAAGGNLMVARDMARHASVVSTQVYSEVEDDELRAVAAVV